MKKGHNDLHDYGDATLADITWGRLTVEPILVPDHDPASSLSSTETPVPSGQPVCQASVGG